MILLECIIANSVICCSMAFHLHARRRHSLWAFEHQLKTWSRIEECCVKGLTTGFSGADLAGPGVPHLWHLESRIVVPVISSDIQAVNEGWWAGVLHNSNTIPQNSSKRRQAAALAVNEGWWAGVLHNSNTIPIIPQNSSNRRQAAALAISFGKWAFSKVVSSISK